jgi:hypothetical protein
MFADLTANTFVQDFRILSNNAHLYIERAAEQSSTLFMKQHGIIAAPFAHSIKMPKEKIIGRE